ncbi:MAG: aldehyde dehydrogenase family protein, partial [Parachlamydiales bacterium]
LKSTLELYPDTAAFANFENAFLQSFEEIKNLSSVPRRIQNRKEWPLSAIYAPFENEPDTDFSLPENKQWKKQIFERWQKAEPGLIPLSIGAEVIYKGEEKIRLNPSNPYLPLYKYILASPELVQKALEIARAEEKNWKEVPLEKKQQIIVKAAQFLREKRSDFIGVLMLDTAKVLSEADIEISQAIDMLEYYLLRLSKLLKMEDVAIEPKGSIAILSSRSFPISLSAAGIAGALLLGNTVLFRPTPDTVLCSWFLASLFWEAGVPKEALQFIASEEEEALLRDHHLGALILTGRNATVEKFLEINPFLDLSGSSEGKNMTIVSAFADRSQAIKNLLISAFKSSGQKYSSVSVAVLEAEVFDDPGFLSKLKEAAANLKLGSIWEGQTQIGPLIRQPDEALFQALTTLEEGEEWLLKPRQDHHNPYLWSPGIKLNIKLQSAFFNQFLPGPLLGLMRAADFEHALAIVSSTKYGLSSTLESLNEAEFRLWQKAIEAGNYYYNRDSHGTIIRRQPFGGHKRSSFGLEYKAGGPNYLLCFLKASQKNLPKEKKPVSEKVNSLTSFLEKIDLSAEELGIWYASVANYAYWWHRMELPRDPTKIVGQDNFFGYLKRSHLTFRLYPEDRPIDFLRILAAALTCEVNLEISFDAALFPKLPLFELAGLFKLSDEKEELFFERIEKKQIKRIRLASKAKKTLKQIASNNFCYVNDIPVLANGRFELLHYLKEISLSHDYHRFGNLGARSGELRKPLL